MYPAGFKGAARPLTGIDVARVRRVIGVGEDEIRAVIEIETSGGGFDKRGRPKMLLEPHVIYPELGQGPKRTVAEAQRLAYPKCRAGADTRPEESQIKSSKTGSRPSMRV